MAKIKRLTKSDGGYHGELAFHCTGCNEVHLIYDDETSLEASQGYCWGFNKDFNRPTITPSVLVRYPANPQAKEEFKEWRTERICHSFITDGKIQFLSDCTHELAGKTVDLPEITEE